MRLARIFLAASAALTGFFLSAHVAFAAKPSGPGENTPLNLPVQSQHSASTPGASGGSLVRTFVGLAIVLAVIYGLYWILKQVKSSREASASGSGLASVATLPLGPNRSVHLVRSGREYVLVGASEHGVTPIRTYSEEEALGAGLIGNDVDYDAEGNELAAPAPARPQKSGIFIKDVIDEMRRRTVRK
jgi:flagellar protein FliO/FliZ